MDEYEPPILPVKGPPSVEYQQPPIIPPDDMLNSELAGSALNTANDRPPVDSGFVDETNLVVESGLEDETNLVVESGLEDETPTTEAYGSDYLDGRSSDPENVDNLGRVGRRFSYVMPASFSTEPQTCIHILGRESVVAELLALFMNKKYRYSCVEDVNFRFKNEPGIGHGPTKEAITLFHTKGKDLFYEGKGEMIPRTCNQESKALGRLLHFMFVVTGGFPPFISKPFIFKLLTGRDIIHYDEDCLIKSYINFLFVSDDDDKLILLSAVNDGLENMSTEDRLKVFHVIKHENKIKFAQNIQDSKFKIQTNLQNVDISNWQQELINLAQLNLEKPACKSVADEFKICMKMGGELYSVDEAKEFINKMNPTVDSIIKKVETPIHLTKNEKKVEGFLLRFIASHCDDRKFAERLLMYCTSCTTLPFEPIKVAFSAVSGLMRAVTVNTCDNLLHVPTTYESYKEFEEEFMNTLTSNESSIFSSN